MAASQHARVATLPGPNSHGPSESGATLRANTETELIPILVLVVVPSKNKTPFCEMLCLWV